jgi:NifB/MoaA-like Fe-S oxidoreductase
LLRNRRGATSLRWLRALLDHGIEVHGQIVVCPDRNNGTILDDTLAGVLDQFPELASICVVPLGVSRYNTEAAMRPHTREEALEVVRTVEHWQETFHEVLGHRVVFAADEYYLLAGIDFPPATHYEGFPMHEDGVGMARTFEMEFLGEVDRPTGVATGFFAWVDGAPPEGYRAPRTRTSDDDQSQSVTLRPSARAPIGVLTGPYGAAILAPLLEGLERSDIRIIEVENLYFGGNTAVAGLLTGVDVGRVLAGEPEGHRYLLPDVCLSQGRFLDGSTPEDLPRPVEIIPTDGIALRAALEQR